MTTSRSISTLIAVFAAAVVTAIGATAPHDAEAAVTCVKHLQVTATKGGPFDDAGGGVVRNGCWSFDHTSVASARDPHCTLDPARPVWGYDDTSPLHAAGADAAGVADCARRGGTGYEYAAYRAGRFNVVREDLVRRVYMQLYGSSRIESPTIRAAWLAKANANPSKYAPMINAAAPGSTAAGTAAEVTKLCGMPQVQAIAIWMPSGTPDADALQRRVAIIKALNACSGRVTAPPPPPAVPVVHVNHAPTALHPQHFTVRRGVLARVPLSYGDADGDPLTLTLVAQDFASASVGFKLVPGGFNVLGGAATGTLSFTYRVTDPSGAFAQAHVTVSFA
jgi:hypothetical protein